MNDFWDSFIDSLSAPKPYIMTHLPVEIKYAEMHFRDYFDECELMEKQTKGRIWSSDGTTIYILLDNETCLELGFHSEPKIIQDKPDCLRGYHYDY